MDNAGPTHPSETTIEMYVLGAPLEAAERASLLRHFEECPGCRELHGTIRDFYRELDAETDPDPDRTSALPVPSHRRAPAPGGSPHVMGGGRLPASAVVETALPIRLARWMVKHPVASATAGLGILGLVLLAILPAPRLFMTSDTNPVRFGVRGLMMTILNRTDSVLLAEQVSETYARELQNQDDISTSRDVRILFEDVDGDGTNEFLQVRNPGRPDDNPIAEVVLRSVTSEAPLWTYPVSKQFNFPRRTEGNTPDFGVRTIAAGDFDQDGRMEVYVVTSHSHFPSWVAKLDAVTGKELSLFLHVGHIVTMKFADLDGDGAQDLIVGGRNNSFRRAFVAVLDPRNMAGRGPAEDPYIPENIPPAALKSYILFPRTIIGDAIDNGEMMEMVGGVDVNRAGGYQRVTVNEYNGAHISSSFTVVFDGSMSAINYQTGDNFDILSDSLYRSGVISRAAGPEYMRDYLGGLIYLRGKGWTTRPLPDRFGQLPPRNGTN